MAAALASILSPMADIVGAQALAQSTSTAIAGQVVHSQTGTAFPDRIGPLIRVSVREYGPGDMSAGYRLGDTGDGGIVTFYVYPPAAASAAEELAALSDSLEQRGAVNVGPVEVPQAGSGAVGRLWSLGEARTAAVIVQRDGWAWKARASASTEAAWQRLRVHLGEWQWDAR